MLHVPTVVCGLLVAQNSLVSPLAILAVTSLFVFGSPYEYSAYPNVGSNSLQVTNQTSCVPVQALLVVLRKGSALRSLYG